MAQAEVLLERLGVVAAAHLRLGLARQRVGGEVGDARAVRRPRVAADAVLRARQLPGFAASCREEPELRARAVLAGGGSSGGDERDELAIRRPLRGRLAALPKGELPLVAAAASGASGFPIPVTIVPGTLSDADIDALA